MQRLVLTRCRWRNDAEAHLRILRQQAPIATYEIIFDPVLNESVLLEQVKGEFNSRTGKGPKP